jgi:hypothetical protein
MNDSDSSATELTPTQPIDITAIMDRLGEPEGKERVEQSALSTRPVGSSEGGSPQ